MASRTADVANASRSSACSLRADAFASCRRPHQRVGAGLGQRAVGADLLGEAQHGLLRVRRPGVGAVVGVDQQQVDGVGADVENAQSHRNDPYAVRSAERAR